MVAGTGFAGPKSALPGQLEDLKSILIRIQHGHSIPAGPVKGSRIDDVDTVDELVANLVGMAVGEDGGLLCVHQLMGDL